MEKNVLVDSSFFIGCLRHRQDPFTVLAQADEGWEFYTCGIVVLEVCRGIKLESAMRKYREVFQVMPCVPITSHVWEMASDLGWKLDRKGNTMQATDLLIAASALTVDAAILTLDADFNRVPGLNVLNSI
jgi:predicted nucleic acid-binding protein